jgi:RimJ/RimL family protein N-acetyltransferase
LERQQQKCLLTLLNLQWSSIQYKKCSNIELDEPKNMENQLTLRLANLNDSELLFLWRNDPQSKAASLSNSDIPWADHQAWFSRVLVDPNYRIYIITDADTTPVGMIRTQTMDSDSTFDTEMSWIVAPDARGRGLGKLALQRAADLSRGRVLARIRPENIASQKMAAFAGFSASRDGLYKISEF